jgi:hypothetical protein
MNRLDFFVQIKSEITEVRIEAQELLKSLRAAEDKAVRVRSTYMTVTGGGGS